MCQVNHMYGHHTVDPVLLKVQINITERCRMGVRCKWKYHQAQRCRHNCQQSVAKALQTKNRFEEKFH